MFPEAPVDARRKKVGLLFGAGSSCTVAALALLTGPSPHIGAFVALGCVVIGNAGVIYVGWPRTDGFLVQVRSGRKSRAVRHGRTGGAGIAPGAAAGRGAVPRVGVGLRRALRALAGARSLLLVAALLMPSEAGRRWLAEAESLLFELAPGRRGRALRSYLWSAPRLVVLMWASKLSRWVRSGRG
jgi:hypothetical protein